MRDRVRECSQGDTLGAEGRSKAPKPMRQDRKSHDLTNEVNSLAMRKNYESQSENLTQTQGRSHIVLPTHIHEHFARRGLSMQSVEITDGRNIFG